jgi:hypothetical protein
MREIGFPVGSSSDKEPAMNRIEDVLKDACEDQREALRTFHRTGSWDDAARVHYESCPSCDRALDRLIAERAELVPLPAPIEGSRARTIVVFVAVMLSGLAALGSLGYVFLRPFFDDAAAATEAERMQARLRYVRMPGRPDVCVAGWPAEGGFAPVFVGASRCSEVRERIESDEDMAWHLRDYAIVRIRGTDTCLAHDDDGRFTLPCGSDD